MGDKRVKQIPNCSWDEETKKKYAYVGILDELDGGLEVLTEIDVLPFDVLALVLVLFQDEHVVVEELLQLLVRVVDAQLLKAVHLVFFCLFLDRVGGRSEIDF